MNIFVSGSLAYDRIMDFQGRFEDHILPQKIHVLNISFMVNGWEEKPVEPPGISPTAWPYWEKNPLSRPRPARTSTTTLST